MRIITCIGILTIFFNSFGQTVITTPSSKDGKSENPVDGVYEFCDESASFISKTGSFQEYISANVHYPSESLKMKETGKVYLAFVVEKNGKVSNVVIEKSSNHELLDKEAIRIIENSPKWEPGRINNKRVRSRCRIPINFVL